LIRVDKREICRSGGQVLSVEGFAEQLQEQGNRNRLGQGGGVAGKAAARVNVGSTQGGNHVDLGMFCFGGVRQSFKHGKAIELGQVQIHDQNIGVEVAGRNQPFQSILLAAQLNREGQMFHGHAVNRQQIQVVLDHQHAQAGLTVANRQ